MMRARAILQQHSHRLVTLLLIVQVLIVLYGRVVSSYWPVDIYVSWGGFAPAWVQSLYALRWPFRIFQILLWVGLAVVEWQARGLSGWVRAMVARPFYLAVLIVVIGLTLFSYFLQPGNIGTGDAHGHVPSAWLVKQSWQEGWPFVYWSNYGHMGGPAFQFHNSSYYYLVAIVSYFGLSLSDAHEVTLFLFNAASAWFVFLFVKQLTQSRLAALGSVVAWCASYYHYHLGIDLSRLTASMFMALVPAQFYFTQRLMRAQSHRLAIAAALALITGALVWVHPLYGVLAIGTGGLYAAMAVITQYRLTKIRVALTQLGWTAGAYVGAALVGAYQILPTLVEWRVLGANPDEALSRVAQPEPLTWEAVTAIGSWHGGYIGNSLIVLGLVGALASLVFRYRPGLTITGVLAGLILVAFDPFNTWLAALLQSFPIGASLYTVLAYRLEGFLMFIVLLVAALCGLGIHLAVLAVRRLTGSQWRHIFSRERIALLVMCIVMVESFYYTFRINHKFPDVYTEEIPELGQLYEVLAQQADYDKRVLNLQTGANPSFTIPMLTGHPGLFGHLQDDPPTTVATLQHILARTLGDAEAGRLTPATASLLNQTNIGYVVTSVSTPAITGLQEIASTPYSILWQVPASRPLTLFASSDTAVVLDSQAVVEAHRETNNTVYLEFDSPANAFAQLAYAFYPYIEVRLDGAPVAITSTSLGLIGLSVNQGRHVVEIKPVLSPVRQWTLAVSFIVTGLILAYGFVAVRRFGWRVL